MGTALFKVLLVCFPTDALIEKACNEIERAFRDCKHGAFEVVRSDNPSPEDLATQLSSQKLPSHLPVFVVGHGGARDGEHYIARRKFWDKGGPVNSDLFTDPQNAVRSRDLNRVIAQKLAKPATWYMSCHAGDACNQGGNVGSTCKSWETTQLSVVDIVKEGIKATTGVPVSIGEAGQITTRVDPATRRIIKLLCDPDAFKNADGYLQPEGLKDGQLGYTELDGATYDVLETGRSCLRLPMNKENEQTLVDRIKSGLSPTDSIRSHSVEKTKSGKPFLKVELCHEACVAWAGKQFSPKIENLILYSPLKQGTPVEEDPAHKKTTSH